MADEATDTSKKGVLLIIGRYVYNKKIHERLSNVVNISDDKTAKKIADVVDATIAEYNLSKKIIAQCYDGAPVMSGIYGEVQAIIKRKYHTANFDHISGTSIKYFDR